MGILIVNEYGKDAREFRISQEEVRIGRDPNGEIVLADIGVSRQHVRIFQKSGSLLLEDLGSRNGTIINNTKIGTRETRALHNGDEIQIGRSVLRIVLELARKEKTAGARKEKTAGVRRERSSHLQPTLRDVEARAEDRPLSLFSLQKIEASLLVVEEGAPVRRRRLTKDRMRIGRSPEADIVLADLTVSADHAEIVYNNEGFHVVDRDSRWGTYQNGHPVRIARLQNGNFLRFGKVQALFVTHEEGSEPPVPSFALRDNLIEAHSTKEEEIQEIFRMCREQALDFGEEIVSRGILEPERWWAIAERSRTTSRGPGLLGRLFHRRRTDR